MEVKGCRCSNGNGYVLLMPLPAFWCVLETPSEIFLRPDFAEGSDVCKVDSIFPSHFVKSL